MTPRLQPAGFYDPPRASRYADSVFRQASGQMLSYSILRAFERTTWPDSRKRHRLITFDLVVGVR
jgi:hypothetical protein